MTEEKNVDEMELSDEELDDVAGGAIDANTKGDANTGLRVQLEKTRNKTSTAESFSEIAAKGLSEAADE